MSQSRRQFLRLSGASAAAVCTAGCSSLSGLLGSNSTPNGGASGSSQLSMVPQGVSAVARGDVTATLNDAAVTQFVNSSLSTLEQRESYTGPTTKNALLNEVSSQIGLDITKANTAVGFTKYATQNSSSQQPYLGLWLDASWTEQSFVDAFEQSGYRLQQQTYNGKTVYKPTKDYQTLWLGIVSQTAYVIGTEPAIKDTLDVSTGGMPSLGNGLSTAYSRVRSAPFRFATDVPDKVLPEETVQFGGTTINPQRFTGITHAAGATYHQENTAGIMVKLLTEGQNEAETVREALVGAIAAVESTTNNAQLRKAIGEVTVKQNGSTVVAQVAGSVDRATSIIKLLFQWFILF